MKTLITAIIVSLLLPTFGIGQDADLKSPKAKAAVREYEQAMGDVGDDFEQQLRDLEKSYQMSARLVRARLISNLTEAMEEEARKVNLEEANKIKALMDTKEKGEPFALRSKFNPLPQSEILGKWINSHLGIEPTGLVMNSDRTWTNHFLDQNGKITKLKNSGKWTYNEETGKLRLWMKGWEGRYLLSNDGQLFRGISHGGGPLWLIKLP